MKPHYVEPHNIISALVEEKDIPRVLADAKIMHKMCFMPVGMYNGGYAIAHQQITRKPLRFFVLKENFIVVNPKIISKSDKIMSIEGCLSFPFNKEIPVKRHNNITVEYRTLSRTGELSELRTEALAGKVAFVFQHEIDHFNCKYIYDKRTNIKKSY